MITQDPVTSYPQVSVVTSDTTTLVPDNNITVRHGNWRLLENNNKNLECSQQLTTENSTKRVFSAQAQEPVAVNIQTEQEPQVMVNTHSNSPIYLDSQNENCAQEVTVATGGDSLSTGLCLEDGLADDDSWVEKLSNDGDDLTVTSTEDSSSGEEITLRCTAAIDHEDELRGYHRTAIDFTLHTIVEESCEESEVEELLISNMVKATSATSLEKYFFFDLGEGNITSINLNRDNNTQSETSSICSDGADSSGPNEESTLQDNTNDGELASSRLEKYFLSGFMGFISERRDSDGSVGSDSEGHPSPEQRRKRLVRARGTGRSHSSSLDNLLINSETSGCDVYSGDNQINSDDISSSDAEINEEGNSFEKFEGSADTVKRKKNKKVKSMLSGSASSEELKVLPLEERISEFNGENIIDDDGGSKSLTEIIGTSLVDSSNNRNYQGRDSGFIGSCDDLIKEQKESNESSTKTDLKLELEKIVEERKYEETPNPPKTTSTITLNRKDSFNNWSSDEETNLMMCKMRQFFKTMVANSNNTQTLTTPKTIIPVIGNQVPPDIVPSARLKNRYKPPQLVYFENELTRLMKTVPGIKDEEVREIVEYLSSEDTWSDSYDSSDYTSSDLECATACKKSILRQQISDSCQEIISKFDNNVDKTCDSNISLNKETSFVYQKLVASFEKIATDVTDSTALNAPYNSPPLIGKVMHHIGSRLVALMHEVSSGENHDSHSPKIKYSQRHFHQKHSDSSNTPTEDDDSTTDNATDKPSTLDDEISSFNLLPRSRSHDLLLSESRITQSSSGVLDNTEEREVSDYERFSWRGSFESTLMATDSRNKLSLLGSEGSVSASALAVAAKRRSAGDLMFNNINLSREQLDRVRSCGSIGGGRSEEKSWIAPITRPRMRRSSVPDAASGSGDSADCDEDEDLENRATLPRSLQTGTANTNSLPRLPTTTSTSTMFKSHSMHHFLQQNVKSARYRPPGYNRSSTASPKRASSAPGLQISHQRRGRKSQQTISSTTDDITIAEQNSSPMLLPKGISKSATPSPVAHGKRRNTIVSSQEWNSNEEDIDKFTALHHSRSSFSGLGLRSDSLASVYSGAGEGRYGTVAVRGQVEFGLQYNYKAGALEVLIKQCRDLAAVDIKRNRSDPYVKVYLLPDKSKSGKRKTKVKKHSINPIFDESLRFHISINALETRTLWLTVWHSDMFGRNDFLGEVMINLENIVFDDPTPKWYNLQERTEPFEDVLSFKGDILVCLKYVPPDLAVYKKGKRSRGTLHVKVKEARCLPAVKTNGTSDPFCKSYLLPDKGKSSKQKTAVMRKTVNALWNHTFVYDDVTLQELAERCLELTVWDHDRLGSNEFLGGVRFSMGTGKYYGKTVDWMDSTGKELALWKSMFERPSFWVEGCLPLRPTLDNRTA